MPQNDDVTAESQWREAFRQRVRKAQGKRTQETMASLLGISRETYAKYVGSRGSVMSPRLVLKFCKICDVPIEWLIEGTEVKTSEQAARPAVKPAKITARR